jgi:hypothetical protein
MRLAALQPNNSERLPLCQFGCLAGLHVPGTELEVQEITFLPQSTKTLGPEELLLFEKFLGMLIDCDDTQEMRACQQRFRYNQGSDYHRRS